MTRATIELLMPIKGHVITKTADNDREFTFYSEIAEALDMKVCITYSYNS